MRILPSTWWPSLPIAALALGGFYAVGAATPAEATVLDLATTRVGCKVDEPPLTPDFRPVHRDTVNQILLCELPNASADASSSLSRRHSATASGQVDLPAGNFQHADVLSTAETTWQELLAFRQKPPRDVKVPVTVSVFYETHAALDTNDDLARVDANAFDTLSLNGLSFQLNGGHASAGLSGNDPGGKKSFQFSIAITTQDLLAITSSARCSGEVQTDLSRGSTLRCAATADPILTFDQVTFDAQNAAQGLPTFTLADYFFFERSPNFADGDGGPPTIIPEPSTSILVCGVIFLLARYASRRGASAMPSLRGLGR